ncbi:MAG: hypothetical protein ACD_6C00131G0003 [uncultured bacterium]|jgi:large subunit ribosomal protein L4|nr:MAG: hypothetical protein ACD_6C00131G0003 [uncultured bacterium]
MTKQKPDSLLQAVTFKDLEITAPKKPASAQQFAMWVRSLLQNWRQGTVGVKDRSEVNRTNKKPFKQKGTGRARAGSARSPLWRGGGVVFGPQPRVRTLTVPKGVKKQVFSQLLADRIADKKVIMADWRLEADMPKTAKAVELLRSLSLDDKKVTLFLTAGDMIHYGSFVNIPAIQVLLFDQPNAYDLANSQYWLVLKKDVEAFKQMVEQWQ